MQRSSSMRSRHICGSAAEQKEKKAEDLLLGPLTQKSGDQLSRSPLPQQTEALPLE